VPRSVSQRRGTCYACRNFAPPFAVTPESAQQISGVHAAGHHAVGYSVMDTGSGLRPVRYDILKGCCATSGMTFSEDAVQRSVWHRGGYAKPLGISRPPFDDTPECRFSCHPGICAAFHVTPESAPLPNVTPESAQQISGVHAAGHHAVGYSVMDTGSGLRPVRYDILKGCWTASGMTFREGAVPCRVRRCGRVLRPVRYDILKGCCAASGVTFSEGAVQRTV
jgi:hypothetical protein